MITNIVRYQRPINLTFGQKNRCICLILIGATFWGCGKTEPVISESPAQHSATASIAEATPATPELKVETTIQEPAQPTAVVQQVAPPTVAEPPTAVVPTRPLETVVAPPAKTIQPSKEQIAKWTFPDFASLQLLECYDGFDDAFIQSMAVAPDGKTFFIGGAKLTVWKTGESKPGVDLRESMNDFVPPVRETAVSPDGNWLAAGDQEGTVWIWALQNLQQTAAFKAQNSYLSAMAFAPDSKQLATTDYSGEVSFWNVVDGSLVKKAKVTDEKITEMVYLTSDRIAVTGGEASIWHIANNQRETLLAERYVSATGLTLTHDASRFYYCDQQGVAHSRRIDGTDVATLPFEAHAASLADYSDDGKLLATANANEVRILDAKTGLLQQVIDTDIDSTVAIQWMPKTNLLLIATKQGRVRVWGRPDEGMAVGIKPLQLPPVDPIDVESRSPASAEQLARVDDLRVLPKLSGVMSAYGSSTIYSYATNTTKTEAETFYRYILGARGWTELPSPSPDSMVNFTKQGCLLSISLSENPTPEQGSLNVSLSTAGNFDARWIPKLDSIESGNDYGFFNTVSYRVQDEISAIEVALLKLLHGQGWTAYTRLGSRGIEQPDMRLISLLRGGIEMNVMIGRPANQPDHWAVQTSVNVVHKSLPIPPDAGWIEFDSSSHLMMVANTKMSLPDTIAFYDKQMRADGWLARDAGRIFNEKDARAWSPYIRGQFDATIGMQSLEDGSTRIIVGNPYEYSWQLKEQPKVDPKTAALGIEVADWRLPKGASDVAYNVDDKQLRFKLPGTKPLSLVEQYSKQLEALGWQRSKSGVTSDEYVLATFEKDVAELELRMTLTNGQDSDVSVDGSGLLWNKPLPSPPEVISFGTWLMRHRYPALLDRLDQFATEMNDLQQK